MFKKILIANRGEIAVRIARTCKRLGIHTVGVYSDADKDSLHVQNVDEAVSIGASPAKDSYANAEKIIGSAKKAGVEAIHPGYGFLSEHPAFAKQVEEAGLCFIGPSSENLQALGDKSAARQHAIAAGIPVVPGSDSTVDAKQAAQVAEQIGFPMLVKAVGGGGGIGMQTVQDVSDLDKAIETCAGRGEQSFADNRVYLEKLLFRPRHVEVQVIADKHGKTVALGERECSVQRRHQKIIEESPAPSIERSHFPDAARRSLFEAAVLLFEEVGFQNTGTCEFLIDPDGKFYFLEVNPRLQVEHPVTEMCTGLDLVELQLLVAAGQPLPDEAVDVMPTGHAIEARLCAENPEKNFFPSPGKVDLMYWPTMSPSRLRIDTAIAPGSEVTPFYDSLVAKVITHAATRHQSLLTLDRVLAGARIDPLVTNKDFLRQVLADLSFQAGYYDVHIVDRLRKTG